MIAAIITYVSKNVNKIDIHKSFNSSWAVPSAPYFSVHKHSTSQPFSLQIVYIHSVSMGTFHSYKTHTYSPVYSHTHNQLLIYICLYMHTTYIYIHIHI